MFRRIARKPHPDFCYTSDESFSGEKVDDEYRQPSLKRRQKKTHQPSLKKRPPFCHFGGRENDLPASHE
jgi:hypothetical protein